MAFLAFEPYPDARARLLNLPGEALAAAWVRVHQGSNDEPAEYPGLAHFLEHLLFLDGGRFVGEDGLMRYVQRCGGQVNASTAATYTDYFFQVPTAFFIGAFDRLRDLLTRALPSIDAQSGEREVLHAEFLARSADPMTQRDAAWAEMLPASHPSSRFHAGHRDTLPVEQAMFQEALHLYRKDGQARAMIELVMAGPQSLDEQKQLAREFFAHFSGDGARPKSSKARLAPLRIPCLQVQQPSPSISVGILFDGIANASHQVVCALEHRLRSPLMGGLLEYLRSRALISSLDVRWQHRGLDQAILIIEMPTPDAQKTRIEHVASVVCSWFEGLSSEDVQRALRDYRTKACRLQITEEPLLRIRRALESGWSSDDSAHAAVPLTLSARCSQTLTLVGSSETLPDWPSAGFPFAAKISTVSTMASGFHTALPSDRSYPVVSGQARSLIRTNTPTPALSLDMPPHHSVLFLKGAVNWSSEDAERDFERLAWRAAYHGVRLERCEVQGEVEFRLIGRSRMLPPILEATLGLVQTGMSEQTTGSVDAMPIRRLLADLPQILKGKSTAISSSGHGAWTMLFCSAHAAHSGLLDSLAAFPFQADPAHVASPAERGRRWFTSRLRENEDSTLLLFCPHQAGAKSEAAFRLLARMIEGDFYHRMRIELQLGYAVFSGYRRFGQLGGLLFAIQSPSASGHQMLAHVEAFIQAQLATFMSVDDEHLTTRVAPLKECMQADMGWQRQAEDAWAAVQAGFAPEHSLMLRDKIASLPNEALRAAAQQSADADCGRIVLSNDPAPDVGWSASRP